MEFALPSLALGLRNLLLPPIVLLISLWIVRHFQTTWQPFTDLITYLPYWLLGIVFLLAAQFNRSRLSVLSIFLILFYAIHQQALIDVSFMTRFSDFIFLGGVIFITSLLFIEDRALLSVYGLNRLALAVICFALAWVWLWSAQLWILPGLSAWIKSTPSILSLIRVDMIVIALALTQSIRAVIKPNTTHITLFLTATMWMLGYYWPHFILPAVLWSVTGLFLLIALLADFYWLAYRDELTGLPSRRALNQLALSLGPHYSVAMLDVDHFKKFNDKHGHDVGDQVLKLVATHLRKVKGGGKFFRYGGEEFTIVFPRKNSNEAIPYLEDVRRIIANYKIVLRQQARQAQNRKVRHGHHQPRTPAVSVTISIGVANKQPGQTFEQTLKAADEALYRAKEQGRNRVCQ